MSPATPTTTAALIERTEQLVEELARALETAPAGRYVVRTAFGLYVHQHGAHRASRGIQHATHFADGAVRFVAQDLPRVYGVHEPVVLSLRSALRDELLAANDTLAILCRDQRQRESAPGHMLVTLASAAVTGLMLGIAF